MKMHGIELVCFDLNKTLIEETTWDDLNVALGMSREEDQKYLDLYNAGKIDYREWTKILLDIYKERGLASLKNISESIYTYNYKPHAKELVSYLKKQKYHIALISGSIDILVDKVANELGINLAEANNIFIFNEKDYLENIETFDEDDMAKLRHLESFCRKLSIDITQCVCIGDGDNDKLLFEKSKHGITFEGSKIESFAWKVIKRLQDVEEIL